MPCRLYRNSLWKNGGRKVTIRTNATCRKAKGQKELSPEQRAVHFSNRTP